MPAVPRTFVGFGFGAIQAGLFLFEAYRSGNFDRLVVAEIAPELVSSIRAAGGSYQVNVAETHAIRGEQVEGLEILNPQDPADAQVLARALAEASEICTALPSVDFYTRGNPSVAGLIATASADKAADPALPSAIVYTAENHNHAAEILQRFAQKSVEGRAGTPLPAGVVGRCASSAGTGVPALPVGNHAALARVQFLNTVIGKMSGVVSDPGEIAASNLAPVTPGSPRAFLVEEFNRILITRVTLPSFRRGIEVFIQKPDLLPFEEAKLYGHNAVHALIGYLARAKGCRFVAEAARDEQLMALARNAFLLESGPALIARHQGLDPLFTPEGYRAYAEDLLTRMTNPWLRDTTERLTRDTDRKLGWNDRLIGTMRLALEAGITPERFALGAAAALRALNVPDQKAHLSRLWSGEAPGAANSPAQPQLLSLISQAQTKLKQYGI